ncbi:MAG TPA: H-X9-DG-CTERM domain-containing protein, partial [Pirellulales bacterium]|nr:H-X9-DG-CTERM domain-containing protein [Pirellulales bacterium]
PVSTTTTVPYQQEFTVRQNAGFVWLITGNQNNQGPPLAQPTSTYASTYNPQSMAINGMAKFISGTPVLKYDVTSSAPTGLGYARPSSNHPGGVNAVFCDGHLSFVNEEIPYHVYTQLMTPFQKQAVVDYSTPGPPATGPIRASAAASASSKVITPWIYTLNEADYQ